jgi:hypothetical protein
MSNQPSARAYRKETFSMIARFCFGRFIRQMRRRNRNVRVVVLTQACDLAQTKATRVLVGVVHGVKRLVERGILQTKVIRDQVRTHRVYGWYFLPAGSSVEESVADLRDLHTIPRSMLDRLILQGKRVARIRTPFREHLAQHFSITYSRIGLPEPYATLPDE